MAEQQQAAAAAVVTLLSAAAVEIQSNDFPDGIIKGN